MTDTDDPFSGFEIEELEVLITDDDGTTRNEVLRVFLVDDLETLIAESIAIASDYRDFGEDEEDREFFDVAIQLASLFEIYPKLDQREDRGVNLRDFDKYESLKQMLDMTGDENSPRVIQLLNSSEQSTAEMPILYTNATYKNPEIVIPVNREAYIEFRDGLLEEMKAIRDELSVMATEVARKEMQSVLDATESTQEQRDHARDVLAAEDVFEVLPKLDDATDKIEAMLIKTAIEMEEERAVPFQEPIRVAEELLVEVASKLHANEKIVSRKHANSTIKSTLRIAESVECLKQVICLGEAEGGILEVQPTELIELAISSKDPLQLHEALTWVRENLVNRNECMRLVSREAEASVEILAELALETRYLKMRKHMTLAERRLFRFMCFRSEDLGWRVPALNILGRSFVLGLGSSNAELFFSVIAFGGSSEEVQELERRWKSYLRLYPFLVDLMRFDDREKKRRSKTDFLTPQDSDNLYSQRGSLDEPKCLPAALVDEDVGSIKRLTDTYCTETQKRYVTHAYIDNMTHASIAQKCGVSQQAVSKAITAGLNKIRHGIGDDQLVEFTTAIKKGA